MTLFDAVLVAIPFAAATWATWWAPRWAGDSRQRTHPRQLSEPAVSTAADR